jgi:hypothetical protein
MLSAPSIISPAIQEITECIYASSTGEITSLSPQAIGKLWGTAYQLILYYKYPCGFTSNLSNSKIFSFFVNFF